MRWRAAGGPVLNPWTWVLLIVFVISSTTAAPVTDGEDEGQTQLQETDIGCYYNLQHYDEGDRIITNEPCLNCTCHNRMLMCYLRVCPFTKPIGPDCTVEKRADQCCPIISCPEVPVQLLTSTTEHGAGGDGQTAVGHVDDYGCRMGEDFFTDGAKLPEDPANPCELCYCIRNKTACVMKECTLRIDNCSPVYSEGVCCPVRYDCDDAEASRVTTSTTTTEAPTTPGLIMAGGPQDCTHNGEIYADGSRIETEAACEHCYCMRGEIVCAVQECADPIDKQKCKPAPPKVGECCPEIYHCDNTTDGQVNAPNRKDRKHKAENVTSEELPTTTEAEVQAVVSEIYPRPEKPLHVNEIPTDHDEEHTPVTDETLTNEHNDETGGQKIQHPDEASTNKVTEENEGMKGTEIPFESLVTGAENVESTSSPSSNEATEKHSDSVTEHSSESSGAAEISTEQGNMSGSEGIGVQPELTSDNVVTEPAVDHDKPLVAIQSGTQQLLEPETSSEPEEVLTGTTEKMATNEGAELESISTEHGVLTGSDSDKVPSSENAEHESPSVGSFTTETTIPEGEHSVTEHEVTATEGPLKGSETQSIEGELYDISTEHIPVNEITEREGIVYSTAITESEIRVTGQGISSSVVTESSSTDHGHSNSEQAVTEHEETITESNDLSTSAGSQGGIFGASDVAIDSEQRPLTERPESEGVTEEGTNQETELPSVTSNEETSGEPEKTNTETVEEMNENPATEAGVTGHGTFSDDLATEVSSHADEESPSEVASAIPSEEHITEHDLIKGGAASTETLPERVNFPTTGSPLQSEVTDVTNTDTSNSDNAGVQTEIPTEIPGVPVKEESLTTDNISEIPSSGSFGEVSEGHSGTEPTNVGESLTTSKPLEMIGSGDQVTVSPGAELMTIKKLKEELATESIGEVPIATEASLNGHSNTEVEDTATTEFEFIDDSSHDSSHFFDLMTSKRPISNDESQYLATTQVPLNMADENETSQGSSHVQEIPASIESNPESSTELGQEKVPAENASNNPLAMTSEKQDDEIMMITEGLVYPPSSLESDSHHMDVHPTEPSIHSVETSTQKVSEAHLDDINTGSIVPHVEQSTIHPESPEENEIHEHAEEVNAVGENASYPHDEVTTETEDITLGYFGAVPGEGNCLVEKVTYKNNSEIPPASPCQKSCRCVSSIVHCVLVSCPPAPEDQSCSPTLKEGACCPIYACGSTETQSHSEGTEPEVQSTGNPAANEYTTVAPQKTDEEEANMPTDESETSINEIGDDNNAPQLPITEKPVILTPSTHLPGETTHQEESLNNEIVEPVTDASQPSSGSFSHPSENENELGQEHIGESTTAIPVKTPDHSTINVNTKPEETVSESELFPGKATTMGIESVTELQMSESSTHQDADGAEGHVMSTEQTLPTGDENQDTLEVSTNNVPYKEFETSTEQKAVDAGPEVIIETSTQLSQDQSSSSGFHSSASVPITESELGVQSEVSTEFPSLVDTQTMEGSSAGVESPTEKVHGTEESLIVSGANRPELVSTISNTEESSTDSGLSTIKFAASTGSVTEQVPSSELSTEQTSTENVQKTHGQLFNDIVASTEPEVAHEAITEPSNVSSPENLISGGESSSQQEILTETAVLPGAESSSESSAEVPSMGSESPEEPVTGGDSSSHSDGITESHFLGAELTTELESETGTHIYGLQTESQEKIVTESPVLGGTPDSPTSVDETSTETSHTGSSNEETIFTEVPASMEPGTVPSSEAESSSENHTNGLVPSVEQPIVTEIPLYSTESPIEQEVVTEHQLSVVATSMEPETVTEAHSTGLEPSSQDKIVTESPGGEPPAQQDIVTDGPSALESDTTSEASEGMESSSGETERPVSAVVSSLEPETVTDAHSTGLESSSQEKVVTESPVSGGEPHAQQDIVTDGPSASVSDTTSEASEGMEASSGETKRPVSAVVSSMEPETITEAHSTGLESSSQEKVVTENPVSGGEPPAQQDIVTDGPSASESDTTSEASEGMESSSGETERPVSAVVSHMEPETITEAHSTGLESSSQEKVVTENPVSGGEPPAQQDIVTDGPSASESDTTSEASEGMESSTGETESPVSGEELPSQQEVLTEGPISGVESSSEHSTGLESSSQEHIATESPVSGGEPPVQQDIVTDGPIPEVVPSLEPEATSEVHSTGFESSSQDELATESPESGGGSSVEQEIVTEGVASSSEPETITEDHEAGLQSSPQENIVTESPLSPSQQEIVTEGSVPSIESSSEPESHTSGVEPSLQEEISTEAPMSGGESDGEQEIVTEGPFSGVAPSSSEPETITETHVTGMESSSENELSSPGFSEEQSTSAEITTPVPVSGSSTLVDNASFSESPNPVIVQTEASETNESTEQPSDLGSANTESTNSEVTNSESSTETGMKEEGLTSSVRPLNELESTSEEYSTFAESSSTSIHQQPGTEEEHSGTESTVNVEAGTELETSEHSPISESSTLSPSTSSGDESVTTEKFNSSKEPNPEVNDSSTERPEISSPGSTGEHYKPSAEESNNEVTQGAVDTITEQAGSPATTQSNDVLSESSTVIPSFELSTESNVLSTSKETSLSLSTGNGTESTDASNLTHESSGHNFSTSTESNLGTFSTTSTKFTEGPISVPSSTEKFPERVEIPTEKPDNTKPEDGYDYQKPVNPLSEKPQKPVEPEEHEPNEYDATDEDYDSESDTPYGPGTCRYAGKVYVSAQQIPRDDPCDFCFCFRSDIICLQQSCPPPIPGCHEEPISGFCCPRYECHVRMATMVNSTSTTTTTTTTLPPHFMKHHYRGAAVKTGCMVQGRAYRVGESISSASGPCMDCICGGDGRMKCEPKVCSPEPMIRKMLKNER